MTAVTFTRTIPYDANGRPSVPVRISHSGKQTPALQGLVDSGADASVFPVVIATWLGIDISACPIVPLAGVNGVNAVRECRVTLHLLGRRIEADVWFNPDSNSILLGRRNVFRHFLFAFDEQKATLLSRRY